MWICAHCDGQTDDQFQICWTCRVPRGQPADYFLNSRVVVSTTNELTTHEILQYVGPVFGEVVSGTNMFRDVDAAVADFFGGRAESYEQLLMRSRTEAIFEMQQRAERLGCNAVVGVDVNYESIGKSMFLVCASGTAVIATPRNKNTGKPD